MPANCIVAMRSCTLRAVGRSGESSMTASSAIPAALQFCAALRAVASASTRCSEPEKSAPRHVPEPSTVTAPVNSKSGGNDFAPAPAWSAARRHHVAPSISARTRRHVPAVEPTAGVSSTRSERPGAVPVAVIAREWGAVGCAANRHASGGKPEIMGNESCPVRSACRGGNGAGDSAAIAPTAKAARKRARGNGRNMQKQICESGRGCQSTCTIALRSPQTFA